MSECVVRMEMQESCKKCKNPLCLWLNDDCDFIVDHIIAAVQDFRKKNDDGFPDFCPIICSIPEGHGRLIDERNIFIPFDVCDGHEAMGFVEETPTIVPAERSET